MSITSMSITSFYLLTILLHVPSAEAGPGLRGMPLPPQMNRTDVETALMSELSGVFRGGAVREHISSLEVALNEMYTSVPKEAGGTLSHAVVRYMLHRFFVQKHGWFIRGLEPGNASALQAMAGGNQTLQNLQEWVPSYLQNFLEEVLGGRGLSLRELAVLAATLEDLIHKESNTRLEMTFTALELPFSAQLDEDQLRQALEVYMMIYMLGGNFTVTGKAGILRAHGIFAKKVKDWETVQQWMHSIQVEVAPSSIHEPVDFTGASRVVEEVGRRYGIYNDAECGTLKAELLGIESTKAGRVRLADFYKKGLSGVFEFNEKIEYLRALGTVDESNASDPYLIVPNYVASRPNCLKASSFYVVCCRNECEDLLASLEKKFSKPMASPQQILELVATFSTKTVEQPRMVSDSLVKRLHSIADANEGEVPLHGRLFAQWMHHAFPRECPYPQKAGDASPMTADEWMQATGHENARKTNEEMQVIVDSDSCILPVGEKAQEHHNLPENELPWDEAEELLAARPAENVVNDVVTLQRTVAKAPKRSFVASAARMAAIASLILSVAALAWKMQPQNTKAAGQWRDGIMA